MTDAVEHDAPQSPSPDVDSSVEAVGESADGAVASGDDAADAQVETELDPVPDLEPDPVPDRGHLLTEQRMRASAAIDALPTEQALQLINTQDAEVPRIIRKAIPSIAKVVDQAAALMRLGGRLIYCGAGTSGRLGVLDASEMPPTFHSDPSEVVGLIAGGDTALRKSSESVEDQELGPVAELEALDIGPHDTLIGIAAGGTTPWVWGALRLAHERGAATALMCCVPAQALMIRHRAPLVPANQASPPPPPKPTLPVPVDHVIELPVGPEVITGSTRMKAGTATKLVLNMISTSVMVKLGKTWGNLMVDLKATNDKLRDRAARILGEQCKLERNAALELLDAADGKVKLALIMHKRNVDLDAAQALLDQHDQHLRPIIGEPR